ncbi:ATP phosphoribosyltransferase regulatory subunit [Haloglomus halophilum]|uniref:ATP phosphoribosyltransferase regulatory subunit n=1 Tax=Haloglomus halophilum TaxID=2962672 RepID=UPI0020C98034|nr:ATP phosphoribosyltransferase regulatory subunit [Haloglomus halophilum]
MTDLDTTEPTTRPVRQCLETTLRRQGYQPVDYPTLAPASRYADHGPGGLLAVADPADESGERSARDGDEDTEDTDDTEEETVLVPELTTALARAVTAGDDADPEQSGRWRATGPCWRAAGVRADDRREFHRTAAIRLDEGGPDADAELLSLAASALDACGLDGPGARIRVSHRGLLAAVFDSFSGDIDIEAALTATATHDTTAEAYHEALVEAGLNYGQADTLTELLGVGIADLDALADLTGSDAVRSAVDDLRTVLDAAGEVVERVEVSLAALPDRPYDTGITVRVAGTADGHPPAVLGGRFDARPLASGTSGASGAEPRPAVGLEFDHPVLARLRSRAE